MKLVLTALITSDCSGPPPDMLLLLLRVNCVHYSQEEEQVPLYFLLIATVLFGLDPVNSTMQYPMSIYFNFDVFSYLLEAASEIIPFSIFPPRCIAVSGTDLARAED